MMRLTRDAAAWPRWLWLIAGALGPFVGAVAQEPPRPKEPVIAPASDEARNTLRGFKLAPGLKVELAAAEPLVANPVAFFLDGNGRAFVCESFRQNRGVTDNRGHDQAWLDDDLAAQTVADREAYHRKHLRDKVAEYTAHDDRIRLLTDTNGDGLFDQATVFANGFNRLVDGTGAGVLYHEGHVYYTCIPDLWLLRDQDGDGVADSRKSLHTGYGVRVAFRGHDLHGLCLGPDGRLYFSIGDRGYHVETESGRHVDPESGAVFRCELDGTRLEVFARGLRNPQELAFDDRGNLFTGDNNSDSGDRARWVYVVKGGDTGWRMSYQYLPDRGPFNRERIWQPYHADQPAYIIPPVANVADGPSGLAYYPGVGLAKEFQGRFLLCDFRGGAANSGIRSFRVTPRGAFFELTDAETPIWNILATDLDFGPDGSLYVADWVDGWDGVGKGRLYRFSNTDPDEQPLRDESRQLLSQGVRQRSDLPRLMGHADRRVRLLAQFELVRRGDVASLTSLAQTDASLLARLHAIWGLGQLARQPERQVEAITGTLRSLLSDEQEEVRAQAAKVLGEATRTSAKEELLARLRDESPRVRYFAAVALGDLQSSAALTPLTELLAANADQDPILRHGGIMGLAGIPDAEAVSSLATHPSPSVRLAAVVALRKRGRNEIARFLDDPEPKVALEAARAIHDLPLEDALPELAKRIERSSSSDDWWRRVLNANFRLGTALHAEALARAAGRSDVPLEMRLEALRILGAWAQPAPRDRVLGMWRPLGQRDPAVAAAALRHALGTILAGPDAVRAEGAQVAAQLGIKEATQVLLDLLANQRLAGPTRADALLALDQLAPSGQLERARGYLADNSPELRIAARRLVARWEPDSGLPIWREALQATALAERQAALDALGNLPGGDAGQVIAELFEQFRGGKLAPELELELLEAAGKRSEQAVIRQLTDWEQRRASAEPTARYSETLAGGNAERGRQIFFERTEVSCVRCHKIDGRGGEVGPDLSKLAQDKLRTYLLEAIVDPNRTIAKGFESATVIDQDGRVHSGVVRLENESELHILSPDGNLVKLRKSEIDERQPAKSPMPEDLVKKLTRRELRDLVEYLSGRK